MRTLSILSFLCVASSTCIAVESNSSDLTTVYWEFSRLNEVRNQAESPDDDLQRVLQQLRRNADEALKHGPYSVVFKKDDPPSGDKHDYMSFSRYWWPNPDTPDGLPYVRRDGQVNVEIRQRGDRDQIGLLFEDVETLALAYHIFQDERYAAQATRLIKVWFLDPKTRMNPHVEYGQAVPGRSVGRGVGIIDSRGFIKLLDALALLSSSESFGSFDVNLLQRWFSDFLTWLRTSDLGKEEASAENNHGSWYAAQTARIALFVGARDIAREIVEQIQKKRIPNQFLSDGRQPMELKRTQSLHYSLFNLEALSIVARVGEYLDIDLWQEGPNRGNLHRGIEFLQPYLLSQKGWPYPQMNEYALSRGAINLLRMASLRYKDARYLRPIKVNPHRHPEYDYAALLFHAKELSAESPGEVAITVTADARPDPVQYKLPNISGYSIESIVSQVPREHSGAASIGPSAREPILSETFRKDRRKDFQRRQGSELTRVIKISGGVITLDEVSRQLDDESILSIKDGIAILRLPILVKSSATLVIDGKVTTELRLSTDRGVFLANAGTLYVVGTKVTSWNEQNQAPAEYRSKNEFRPFISSYIRSSTYLAGSTFHQLGYHAPTSYGISLSSQPERDDPDKKEDWPTGIIVGNEFYGIYYGFYSYEARGVVIVDNKYTDCILYGIDPHDRSTELIIAGNTAASTRERHGIIGSRGVSDSYIFDNITYGNAGSGIMLDRRCFNNVICDNKVFGNGQGIAIYESFSNIVANNIVVQNKKSGVRARNSSEITVIDNEIVANGDYGLELSSKRLEDHNKRVNQGDVYDQFLSVSVFGNVVTGNYGGVMKGRNVTHLLLNNVDTNPNLDRIETETGLSGLKLETEDDHKFGSDFKSHSAQLVMVFEDSLPLVEFRQAMCDYNLQTTN